MGELQNMYYIVKKKKKQAAFTLPTVLYAKIYLPDIFIIVIDFRPYMRGNLVGESQRIIK